jgi:hypothetical protein
MSIISVMMLCHLSPNTKTPDLMILSPNMAIPIPDSTNFILTLKLEPYRKSVGLWDLLNLVSMFRIFRAMVHGYRRKLSIQWFTALHTTALLS